MKRREFITLLSAAAVVMPRAALGQTPAKVFHVGTVSPGPPRDEKGPTGATLLRALAERGYVVGKNLTFSAYSAKGQTSNIPRVIGEMRTAGVNVIVTVGFPTALAAKASGIPVVIASAAAGFLFKLLS